MSAPAAESPTPTPGRPGFFRDLFMGPENAYWDLGRILIFLAGCAMVAGQAWNMRLGLPIDLGDLGTGFGWIFIGAGGLIFAKDRSGALMRTLGRGQ